MRIYRRSELVQCSFCIELAIPEEAIITEEANYCPECWAEKEEAN